MPESRARRAGRDRFASRGTAGLVLLIAFLPSCSPPPPGERTTPRADPLDAKSVCKDFVRDRLVSPSTADFQNVFEMSATALSETEWVVYGYVDSQNRAGTVSRSTFKCQVRQRAPGVDSWSPVSIEVGERR